MTMRPARFDAFWQWMLLQLATPRMLGLLGGAGRLYLEGQDYSQPPQATPPWGRLILVPTQTVWPSSDAKNITEPLAWLVRAEVADFRDPSFSTQKALENVQDEAWNALYLKAPLGIAHLLVVQPFYLQRPGQPLPQWDEGRGLWWSSSEWRCMVMSIEV